MTRAILANCCVPAGLAGDLLLTDEPTVAAAGAGVARTVSSPEASVDAEAAHAASVTVWRTAFMWFRRGAEDPTRLHGVSAGDLAGMEAAITVIGPAARAALATGAALAREAGIDELVCVAPEATPQAPRYDRLEGLAADAAAHAARVLGDGRIRVERAASREPGNLALRDKYARTRDPELLLGASRQRDVLRLAYAAANRVARVRRRGGGSLLVVEYNPTLGFSRTYAARSPRLRMVRWLADPRELLAVTRAGDLAGAPPTAPPARGSHRLAGELSALREELAGREFAVAGVPLWPVILPRLTDLVGRYAAFVEHAAPRVRAALARDRVQAVLVPYDTSPGVRLLVRTAQDMGIPTFVVNDGYKGDDIGVEGMAADVALVWSQAIAGTYFRRHPGEVLITGNPKLTGAPPATRRSPGPGPLRVLVGSFTFSPVDLNCRRGDAERFLDEVLQGIAAALPAADARVVVKLHPADEPAHLRDLLARHPGLQVELVTSGDVLTMFSAADVYVTTYSTSLLEAATTMPTIYYRVNAQRIGPPFDGDAYLSPRTADRPAELARLLRDRATLEAPPPDGWLERHLGARGAEARIVQAIETRLRKPLHAPR